MSEPTTSAAQDAPIERDENGRFAPGNRGGPGNPFARQVGRLRKALLDAVTDEDVRNVAHALVEKAKKGDVPAARLLFGYVLGKQAGPTDPDRLDVQEWQHYREQVGMMNDVPVFGITPEPWLPLETVRALRPSVTETRRRTLLDALRHPEKVLGDVPSPDGANGTAPVAQPPRRRDKAKGKPAAAAKKAPPAPNGFSGGPPIPDSSEIWINRLGVGAEAPNGN